MWCWGVNSLLAVRDEWECKTTPVLSMADGRTWLKAKYTIYTRHCTLWHRHGGPPFTNCLWKLVKYLVHHSPRASPPMQNCPTTRGLPLLAWPGAAKCWSPIHCVWVHLNSEYSTSEFQTSLSTRFWWHPAIRDLVCHSTVAICLAFPVFICDDITGITTESGLVWFQWQNNYNTPTQSV